jgi:Zn-dependent peptidase ImmA (M78 family)
MVYIPVAPSVLVWARKERGLSLESASARLRMPATELAEIENGSRQISLGTLEHIATHYRIPLVSLLMPDAPAVVGRPLHDFRAFEGRPASELSPETVLAIDEAWAFLEMLADLKDADPEAIGQCLVPPFKLSDDPVKAAKTERERLKITASEQRIWSGDREAFLRWREVVEAQGVFTYQMKFGADGTRGLSLWDDNEIPIVVIDSSENGYQARIFTLWHEYAHIILRMGGISDQNRRNNIERFCNAFAAHFLMPMDVFVTEARAIAPKRGEWTDWHVARLSNIFKVSKSSVALHLEEANMVTTGFYAQMKALWANRNPSSSGGRAEHQEKIANRLGGKYILTVIAAYKEGVLNRLDAKEYLGVRPKFFTAIEQEALDRRVAYGRTG